VLTFLLALSGIVLATVVASFLLNFTGDCGPEVTNCGETSRRISFVVESLGLLAVIWLVLRFVRHPNKF
jgi:hypothetical protein